MWTSLKATSIYNAASVPAVVVTPPPSPPSHPLSPLPFSPPPPTLASASTIAFAPTVASALNCRLRPRCRHRRQRRHFPTAATVVTPRSNVIKSIILRLWYNLIADDFWRCLFKNLVNGEENLWRLTIVLGDGTVDAAGLYTTQFEIFTLSFITENKNTSHGNYYNYFCYINCVDIILVFRRNATHCILPYAIVVCVCVCMCVCVCLYVSVCICRVCGPQENDLR